MMVHSRFITLAALASGALLCLGGRPADAAVHNITPAQLQATIDSAAPFDTINVSAGTVTQYIGINKALTINGAKVDVPGVAPARGSGETILSKGAQITADDVTLNGFAIQGAVNGKHPQGWGMFVSLGVSNTDFINNVVQDNVVGLYINGSDHTVQYNLFRSNNRPGSLSGDAIYSDRGLSDTVISNNSFTSHRNGTIVVVGAVKGGAVSDLTIANNSILNDGTIAIFNATDVSITGNVSWNTLNGHALHLGGGNVRVTVQGNQILGSRYRGIRIANSAKFPAVNQDIRIYENDIANNVMGGLSVVAGSYTDAGGTVDTDLDGEVDAECNAWGAVDGPAPLGDGNKVSGAADYVPFKKYMDLSSPVTVTLLQTYGGSGTYLQVIRITNTGGKAVVGNAYYVIDNLSLYGVGWTNATAGSLVDDCDTLNGGLWYKFVDNGGKLLPGQSLIVTLRFTKASGFDTSKIGGTDGSMPNLVGRGIRATNYK